MSVEVIVKNAAVGLQFTVSQAVVNARRALNLVTYVPGATLVGTGVAGWVPKTVGFAPNHGGAYLADTSAAELNVFLPENPPDKFQFYLKDRKETWSAHACVLARGNAAHKVAMRDVDEFALDYTPGVVIVVFDAALNNWSL